MKKFLIILILTIFNITVFASYYENCEIIGIVHEEPKPISGIKCVDGICYPEESATAIGIQNSSMSVEVEVIEVKKIGRNDNNCAVKGGINTYFFKYENIEHLKKGQKIRFKRQYSNNKGEGPKTSFYDLEVIE